MSHLYVGLVRSEARLLEVGYLIVPKEQLSLADSELPLLLVLHPRDGEQVDTLLLHPHDSVQHFQYFNRVSNFAALLLNAFRSRNLRGNSLLLSAVI